MNDFTKEELVALLLWGLDRIEVVGINKFIEEEHMELFNKLQEKVVDYCEHEEELKVMNE